MIKMNIYSIFWLELVIIRSNNSIYVFKRLVNPFSLPIWTLVFKSFADTAVYHYLLRKFFIILPEFDIFWTIFNVVCIKTHISRHSSTRCSQIWLFTVAIHAELTIFPLRDLTSFFLQMRKKPKTIYILYVFYDISAIKLDSEMVDTPN